ncbi:MAG: hypothetical protein EON90_06620 [Brevundimonas sp.]|nr:MAG: hypothetical protein EON90_06620 [Brevundimonas sp.]
MKTEPNLLAASVTAIALGVLVLSAGAMGEPAAALKYVALSFGCIALFIAFSRFMLRSRGRVSRPLIRPENKGAVLWLSLFPVVVLATAALPLIAPRADYTLMIAIAAIWTAVTIQSAIAARRPT